MHIWAGRDWSSKLEGEQVASASAGQLFDWSVFCCCAVDLSRVCTAWLGSASPWCLWP